jgi:hypothetical protein
MAGGCAASKHLAFPEMPLERVSNGIHYDLNGNGKVDFALLADSDNRTTILAYDDREDGHYDRIYRINDYDADRIPHLIILLDSIPYQSVLDFYNAGHFSWFPPPQKVIAPFPSLSFVIFNRILQAPPRLGTNNHHYDHRVNAMRSSFWRQLKGTKDPWQRYLHYDASYITAGLGFVQPQKVYRKELKKIKQTLDESVDRVTIVYIASSAGMVCKYGAQGVHECLELLERLCTQLLWERQGAIMISILADHGHNLTKSQFVSLPDTLNAAGFTVRDKIESDKDIVIDTEGLVTYAGIHTLNPTVVADVLLKLSEIELALYMDGARVIVRDAQGSAAIEKKNGKLRYVPIDRDVLSYRVAVDSLRAFSKTDTEGYAIANDWFEATVDHIWPNAPPRIWDAFHGIVVSTPDLMIAFKDGYHSGFTLFESFIDMASTHGGLNQANCATFLLSMTGRATRPLRSEDVMQTIEPNYVPAIRNGR